MKINLEIKLNTISKTKCYFKGYMCQYLVYKRDGGYRCELFQHDFPYGKKSNEINRLKRCRDAEVKWEE